MTTRFTLIAFFVALFFAPANAQVGLNFDGLNDYINCGNNPSVDITGNAITLEAWIYPTSFKPQIWEGNIINKNDVNQSGYMLRVGGAGQVNFNIGSGGAWNELNTVAGVVTLNTWQHVAAVYNGATMEIYVDGVVVASMAMTQNIASAFQPLYLGEDPEYNNRYFPGSMDEVRIWNVARTQSEIQAAMANEICNTDPTLAAYYRFNGGIVGGNNAGQITLTDESGNGNDGTLNNFANSGNSSNWTAGVTLGAGMTNTILDVDACDSYFWAESGQTYTTSGQYSELLTGVTGCDSTVTLDLTIFSPNNLTSNQVSCDSFTWNVNGNTYYNTTSIVENLTTGQGCQYTHTLNLTINQSFDTVVLVYDECPPYLWDVNGVSYDTSGTYFANFTTAAGCDSNYQLNLVIYDNAVADITENTDGSLSTSWTFDVQWFDCATGSPITGETGMTFVPTANGDYGVIAYGPNWCPDTSSCYTVDYVGLSEIQATQFNVYPNPSSGKVYIDDANSIASIRLFSMDGKEVEAEYHLEGDRMEIVLPQITGTYMLEIIDLNGGKARKTVVKE